MKTRIETRTRHIPMTIDGVTQIVPEEYEVVIPVPPRDWDQAAAIITNIFAFFAVVAAVIWTTTSVGGLLHRHAPAFSSYVAAAVFDVVWIGCMIIEWMARHNPAKAKPPRIGGHISLLISMTAVTYSGHVDGSTFTGLMEASVSLAAKGLWTMVINHYKVVLDPQHQAWVDARAQDVGARKVLAHLNRQDLRTRGQLAAFVAAQAASQATTYSVSHDLDSDSSKTKPRGRKRTDADGVPGVSDGALEVCSDVIAGQSVVPESVPPTVPSTVPLSVPPAKTSGTRSKRDQILAAAAMLPSDATNTEIAQLLSSQGIQVSAKYVYNTLRSASSDSEKLLAKARDIVAPDDPQRSEAAPDVAQDVLPDVVQANEGDDFHPGYL